MPTIADLLVAIDQIAPFALAESWDNVGLLIGSPSAECERVLVALEVTPDVIEEATRLDVHAIVAHHPLVFRPLKSLAETTPQTRMIAQLTRANIALIAAHTNWDSVPDGTNGEIADRLGIINRTFLSAAAPDRAFKYVVFVPTDHLTPVIDAINTAGAGVIGNYTHCTFRTPGTGTYKPDEGANPFAGEVGKLEQADEVRLETVCPADRLTALIEAVNGVHPYEEVAFDVLPLEPTTPARYGLGLIGDLPEPMTLGEFARSCKTALGHPAGQAIGTIGQIGDPGRTVRRIAICSGGGGSFVSRAIAAKVDAYVTGEMTHHEAADLQQAGLGGVLLGHFGSEVIANGRLAEKLRQHAALQGVRVAVSESEKGPVVRV